MNTAILIASREMRDRSRLFLIAACMAVIPFVAAFAVRENRPLAIATVAGFLAVAYSCSLALALGVSTIGNELGEKRLSFLFSKPVSAAAVWIGKAAGSLLTVFGALAIVILPTYVLAHRGWDDMWSAGGYSMMTYAVILSIVLFLVGHTASTMLRSRSARVGIDFALFGITTLTLYALLRPILLGGGLDVVLKIMIAVSCAIVLLLAVAPVWQLAKGRVDARANHAALSTVLWSGMAVVLIAAGSYAIWVISPPLSSINERFVVDQTPSGKWAYMSGHAPGRGSYLASFLVDTATGQRERIALPPFSRAQYSSDGRMIAWMQSEDLWSPRSSFRLYTRRLEPGAKQIPTQIVGGSMWAAQLSEDGSRIAMVRAGKLEVYEIATSRQLAVAPGVGSGTLRFLTPDLVQLVELSAKTLFIREFDLVRRKLTTTLERPRPMGASYDLSADGTRLFLPREAVVIDTHTGATVATLPVKPEKLFFATMLRDGSLIVTRDSKLIHIDRSGTVIAEVPIPVRQAGVAGQIGSSKVLLGVRGEKPEDRRMFIVDLAAHKVERTIDGVLGPVQSWYEAVMPQFPEDASFVGVDASQKLMVWDARTGTKRPFPL